METPDEARAKRTERNRRMLESWRAGESITAIAREHGLSTSWTGRLLRQEGAVLPESRQGVRRTDLPVAEIIRKYKQGASIQALADENNAAYGTIRRLLLRNDVRIRPHGGQNAIALSPLLTPRFRGKP
ncbi:helix-turn-helix domain-containing protein [Amycolatopsis sp. VS8301801F10]|uniref:helix-turn-helix domain-containing protein n=1 Tax=unclassified Amycolatopsis TaxID=2618356 RepID=UPI0038FBE9EF